VWERWKFLAQQAPNVGGGMPWNAME